MIKKTLVGFWFLAALIAQPVLADLPDTAGQDYDTQAMRCWGIATPCHLLDVYSCQAQLGCHLEVHETHKCGGIVSPCFMITNPVTCEIQKGCRWF